MATVAPAAYTIVPLDHERDRETIVALWQRNFGGGSPARFRWLYEQGPTRGFALRTAGGECVGGIGCLERKFRIGGREFTAGQAIDINVNSDHRTIGPALKLQRTVVAPVAEGRLGLMYSFPNEQAEGVLGRIGYKSIGRFQRWVKLLSARTQLRRRVRPEWLAGVAATVLDAGLRLASPEMFVRTPRGLSFDVVDRFDERFDDLERRTITARPILGDRSAKYLNWRIAGAPEVQCQAFTLSGNDGRLAAYLTFYRHGDGVSVNDFLYADVASWRVLVAEFIRRMRHERVEEIAIGFLGPTDPTHVLRKLGFWSRPSTWNVMVYAPDWPTAEAAGWLDVNQWWLTRADVDTDD
jgi:hypothetical protein